MNRNIHNLARAVIIKDNHILLGYDPRPEPIHYYDLGARFFYLPGGHIEFKESAANALLREITEEIGYVGVIERYLGSIENSWSFEGDEVCCHTYEINHIFKCDIAEINAKTKLPQVDEDIALSWIKLSNIADIDLRPGKLKELIPFWLSHDFNNVWHSLM